MWKILYKYYPVIFAGIIRMTAATHVIPSLFLFEVACLGYWSSFGGNADCHHCSENFVRVTTEVFTCNCKALVRIIYVALGFLF